MRPGGAAETLGIVGVGAMGRGIAQVAALGGIAVRLVGARPGAAVERLAAVLGLGYPCGPHAWGDRLGPSVVLEILDNVHALTRDPRYRPSPWLRCRAELGASLLTPEA